MGLFRGTRVGMARVMNVIRINQRSCKVLNDLDPQPIKGWEVLNRSLMTLQEDIGHVLKQKQRPTEKK